MKPIYSLLPTLPEGAAKTSEEKNLLESSSTEENPEFNIHPIAIPRKILAISYVFLALTAFLAATNVVLSVRQMRLGRSGVTALDDLPRPDVFVGLPKLSKLSAVAMPNMPSHNHSHSHIHHHDGSDCEEHSST